MGTQTDATAGANAPAKTDVGAETKVAAGTNAPAETNEAADLAGENTLLEAKEAACLAFIFEEGFIINLIRFGLRFLLSHIIEAVMFFFFDLNFK